MEVASTIWSIFAGKFYHMKFIISRILLNVSSEINSIFVIVSRRTIDKILLYTTSGKAYILNKQIYS